MRTGRYYEKIATGERIYLEPGQCYEKIGAMLGPGWRYVCEERELFNAAQDRHRFKYFTRYSTRCRARQPI